MTRKPYPSDVTDEEWVFANTPNDLIYSGDPDGYGYRFKDDVLGALSNQYSKLQCSFPIPSGNQKRPRKTVSDLINVGA
jgi:hypothetical protein